MFFLKIFIVAAEEGFRGIKPPQPEQVGEKFECPEISCKKSSKSLAAFKQHFKEQVLIIRNFNLNKFFLLL